MKIREQLIANNLLLAKSLVDVQKNLLSQKIPAIHLKGALQHFFLTGGYPDRIIADIDILVPSPHFKKTVKFLLGHGYRMRLHISGRPPTPENAVFEPQVTFVSGNKIFLHSIDLHQLLFLPSYLPDIGITEIIDKKITLDFVRRGRVFKFMGLKVRILSPEDMLIYQSLNFLFHHGCRGKSRLQSIYDITSNLSLNWNIVVRRLKQLGFISYSYFIFRLAAEIKKGVIPEKTLKKLLPKSRFTAFIGKKIISSANLDRPFVNSAIRRQYVLFLQIILAENSLPQKLKAFFYPAFIIRFLASPGCILEIIRAIFPIPEKNSE